MTVPWGLCIPYSNPARFVHVHDDLSYIEADDQHPASTYASRDKAREVRWRIYHATKDGYGSGVLLPTKRIKADA